MEAETLGDTLSDAQAVVDTLVASQAEVEAETLGDTLSDAQALVDSWLTRKQRWRQRRWVTH